MEQGSDAPGHRGAPGSTLTRRRLLVGGAALGAAAAVGVATAGTPFGAGPRTLTLWHLFGGGDGVRFTTMLATLGKQRGAVEVREVILPWGNPYYTKLALASVGGKPPDIAVMHATKLAEFVPAGMLEPLPDELLARHGLTEDRFLPAPWGKSQWNGRQYAIPMDTHPFVLYYNTDIIKKAGLLGADGRLRPMDQPDQMLDAFAAAKRVTKARGVIHETRGVTPWRLFLTLYSRLDPPPVVSDEGKRVTIDDDKALRVLEWMAQPHRQGTGGDDVDYQASVALFANGSAGFHLNGEWEVTTFQTQKLPFDMTPVPPIFGGQHAEADSHTLVIPRRADRSPERLDDIVAFASRLLGQSQTWAQGGHIPAWRETYESAAYRKLEPQSHYASVADHVVYDPLAWFSGSGSDMEFEAGAAFKSVVTGASSPRQGLNAFRAALQRLADIPKPV
jgi:multiple sugar transport system substrate-binding protein